MVVSASRRTDIPAYYADWLLGRIDAGYCLVRSPYDARRATRVSLRAEDLDFLVLWTRDIRRPDQAPAGAGRPRHPFLRANDGDRISARDRAGRPSLDEATDALRELGDQVGGRRGGVALRPDPRRRGPGRRFPPAQLRAHRGQARGLRRARHREPRRRVRSPPPRGSRPRGFPDARFGTRKKVQDPAEAPREPYPALLSELAALARSRGMSMLSCAEPYELSGLGIVAGACVDASLAASIWGEQSIPPAPPPLPRTGAAGGLPLREERGHRAPTAAVPEAAPIATRIAAQVG